MQTCPAGRPESGRAGAGHDWAGQGRSRQSRAGQKQAEQGRARQGRAKQGRAGRFELVGDLEAVDGVWVADVVLHQAGLLLRDATGVWHQLDAPPSR